jgi:Fe-S cluster biogenesis protein NfuA
MSSPLVGLPIRPPSQPSGPQDDDAIYQMVSELFREQINPAVAKHGGKVELIDVQERTVVVRMKGGCQGCGMATVTLRQGIEASLRRMIPGLAGVRDITDHSAGTRPFYTAAPS